MTLAHSDVFPILASAVTGFEANDEDWEDRVTYFFLSDMIRFVCGETESGSRTETQQLAALLDKLLTEGDSDVRDLVMDGLDTVAECVHRDEIIGHFTPEVMEAWKTRVVG